MKWWPEISIVVVAFGLYTNTLNHDYALDDKAIIVFNDFTQKGFSGIGDHFTHSYWYGLNKKDAGNYRPISGVSFSIEKGLFGDSPKAGHFLNVLFYALLCVVLYRWLLSLEILPKHSLLIAMLIFAAHPIHTEVVANIKSRDEIYCLLFFGLSLMNYWKWLENEKTLNLIGAGLFYLLSLLSKETAIALIPIFPILAMRKSNSLITSVKKSIVPTAVVLFYLTLYLSVTDLLQDQEYHVFDNALVQGASGASILATKFWIIGEYFKLLIVPHPLVYDYSFNSISLVDFTSIQVIITVIAIVGLLVWRVLQFKNNADIENQILTLMLGFTILPLVPVSNFIFIIGSTMAERFLFIPSLGLCLLSMWFFGKLLDKLTLNKPFIYWGFGLLVVAAFGAKTFDRNKDWKDDETLFAADIEHLPNNAKAHHNLANIYRDKAEAATNQAQKVTYYESAARLIEQALAIYEAQEFQRDLGQIYGELGKWEGVKKALGRYTKLNPNDATSWMQLGIAYGITQEMDNARTCFERAYALNPNDEAICLNLAKTYAIQGDAKKALEQANKCLQVAPTNQEIIGLIEQLNQSL